MGRWAFTPLLHQYEPDVWEVGTCKDCMDAVARIFHIERGENSESLIFESLRLIQHFG